jgi:protein-S-isoprenylcysteine O-methyltransferase Ste14
MHLLLLPPSLFVLSAALMILLDRLLPIVQLCQHPQRWSGLLLVVLGLAIARWHARLFVRIGTNIQTFGEPGTLTREGLFAYSRNPMYLGFVLALCGLAIALGSLTVWMPVLAYAVLLDRWHIRFEEAAMARRFGDEYAAYRSQVRRWL